MGGLAAFHLAFCGVGDGQMPEVHVCRVEAIAGTQGAAKARPHAATIDRKLLGQLGSVMVAHVIPVGVKALDVTGDLQYVCGDAGGVATHPASITSQLRVV